MFRPAFSQGAVLFEASAVTTMHRPSAAYRAV